MTKSRRSPNISPTTSNNSSTRIHLDTQDIMSFRESERIKEFEKVIKNQKDRQDFKNKKGDKDTYNKAMTSKSTNRNK